MGLFLRRECDLVPMGTGAGMAGLHVGIAGEILRAYPFGLGDAAFKWRDEILHLGIQLRRGQDKSPACVPDRLNPGGFPMKLETENPRGEGRKTHAWQMAVAAALCMVFAVLLVLPGFLAAWFSRMSDNMISTNGQVNWDQDYYLVPGTPSAVRVEYALLRPSGWLMRHSPQAHVFYNWQYRVAGGLNFSYPIYYDLGKPRKP